MVLLAEKSKFPFPHGKEEKPEDDDEANCQVSAHISYTPDSKTLTSSSSNNASHLPGREATEVRGWQAGGDICCLWTPSSGVRSRAYRGHGSGREGGWNIDSDIRSCR